MHFCAKIAAPCAAVPEPAGNPLPSGITVMFQAASSAGVMGLPRLGVSAPNALVDAMSPAASIHLCIDMFHLAVAADRPARNRIEMLTRECADVRRPRSLAARCDKVGAQRLHI